MLQRTNFIGNFSGYANHCLVNVMTESPFWNDDWMAVQQKYWHNWNEMSRKAMGLEPPKSPWENAMDHWWQALAPSAPNSSREFVEKMMQQGKLFFQMGDQFSRNMTEGKDWQDALNQTLEKMQSAFAAGAEQSAGAAESGFNQMMAFWQNPMNSWRKLAGNLPLNHDMANMPNLFEQMLNAPGLGYTRETEERYKQLMQAGLHYQKAFAAYTHFFSDLGTTSAQRMKNKVAGLKEQGEAIDSARKLYDLWVAACEEVYAEHTMTAEYAKIHGELVNALMAFKKVWNELLDYRLGLLNMPTQREIRTLQCRLQESRRELRHLSGDVDRLKEQIAELAKQPTATPPAAETTAAPKPRKASTSRRKAASKPTSADPS
jgi:class III poly(R)-hydroxyalkanoic acid synthase PhaE subunit